MSRASEDDREGSTRMTTDSTASLSQGAGALAELVELNRDAAEELGLLLSRSLSFDECSVEMVRATVFGDPAMRERYTLGLRDRGRLVAALVGVAQEHSWEGRPVRVGHLKVLATDPTARRRGHATRLLEELESRFAADGLAAAMISGPAYYFWGGLDVRYSAALCLFQRRDYTREGDAFNLEVQLQGHDYSTAAEEDALAAQGITFRRVESTDRAALDAYLQKWGSWREETLRAFDREPINVHIALQAGQIVAFAATDIARPGWFGPTGADEALRGRGIGSILMRRCLSDWQRAGRKSGEISWIGPLYFYVSSVDARVSRVMWYMRKLLGVTAEPPPT